MKARGALLAAALILAACTVTPPRHVTAASVRSPRPPAPPMNETDRRRRVESYYREAMELSREAARLADHTPSTTKAALALSQPQSLGGSLIAREARYQYELEDEPRVTSILDPNVRDALLKLTGVEAFLSQTIHSTLQNCNRGDAELNASVVRALLREARLDLDGRPVANWAPPDILSKTSRANDCRE